MGIAPSPGGGVGRLCYDWERLSAGVYYLRQQQFDPFSIERYQGETNSKPIPREGYLGEP
jgi:hypothetical protein